MHPLLRAVARRVTTYTIPRITPVFSAHRHGDDLVNGLTRSFPSRKGATSCTHHWHRQKPSRSSGCNHA
jgi:hypothetical protein